MLDALVNFAVMNLAFMVIAAIVLMYAVVHITSGRRSTSAQVDGQSREQLAAADRDRVPAQRNTNIHASV
jgi:hypothetical protein